MRKHPLAKCEECPLREIGAYVPSTIVDGAKVAFVGEAPGREEVAQKAPFVGVSGKLLDLVLYAHGIAREDVTLTNACACRPPGNATPAKLAILACEDRLANELQDVKTAVALGNVAAEALLKKSGVTKLRIGPPKPSTLLDGLQVIATIHPAACLRQDSLFGHLVTDVGKLDARIREWTPPEVVVWENEEEALRGLEWLRTLGEIPVTVDIEVDIEKDIAFDHPNQYGLLCIGISTSPTKSYILGEYACTVQVMHTLAETLRGKKIICHNGKFDLAGLYKHCGPLTLWFDTMLASYALDERPGIHGLKHLAQEYLGAPPYDNEVKQYVGPKQGYGVIPRPILYKYCGYDTACTYSLFEMFEPMLERKDLRRLHDHMIRAANELLYVELNGITVDRPYLQMLATEYAASLSRQEAKINDFLSEIFHKQIVLNPRSPQQVAKVLAAFRVQVQSTDEPTLQNVIRVHTGRPVATFAKMLLEHRKEAKLYGTYVKGIRNRLYGGRVYPTFLLHGTTTGRLACRNPNLQNVPRASKIRNMYVPAKSGNVFVQADYGQAELRVLTFLARDAYFQSLLNDPVRDIFDELAQVLYGDVSHLSAPDRKELRIRVKAYVYGLAYGREEFSIAEEFRISVHEARRGMEAFFDVIPGIVAFQKEVKKKILQGHDLINPFGRHRRFRLITTANMSSVLKEGLAFLPQSTASDICLTAMTNLRLDFGKCGQFAGQGIYIRNIVHDSILVECPGALASEVGVWMDKRMIEAARETVGDYVMFKTDTKIGKSWGEV